ncbi:MAG: PQQ-binding-like beta-propeller repeat protein [Planctomycetes bacterium]|nr:PQQ-binding-like beta-propeller repeat protein [Planctomycetota bacterium]
MPDFQALALEAEFLSRFRRTLVSGDDVFAFGASDAGPGFNDLLLCLDRGTGKRRWEFGGRESPFDILSPVCADESAVYVGRNNGVLYALRRDSGTESWRLARGRGMCVPALHGSDLVVSEPPASVLRVDRARGRVLDDPRATLHQIRENLRALLVPHASLLFQVATDGTLTELTQSWPTRAWIASADAFTFGPAALFVAGSGSVRSFDLGDGEELWSTEGPPEVRRLETDGRMVWALAAGGTIGALDALSGEARWSRKIGTASSMAAWKGRVYLDMNAKVVVLDGETGGTVGEIALEGAPYGAVVAEGGSLFVARAAEPEVVMHCVPVEGGRERWRARIGGYGLT